MSEVKKLEKNDVQDIINLTYLQEGLFFEYIKNTESNQYFEQLSIEISQEVNADIFKSAWNKVTQNNDMLRVVFRWENISKPVQIILNEHETDIRYVDYSNENKDVEILLEDLKKKDREEKFVLTEVPFRITLCKIREDKYYMIMSNHHIIFDGWSSGIILKEFLETYNELSEGKENTVLSKGKFKDFVNIIKAENNEESQVYWKNYLVDFDTKAELSIKKKKNNEVKFADKYEFKIDGTKVDSFIKENKITLAQLIYTAWGIVLKKYNYSDDVIFGTTVSGRNVDVPGIENMVGLCINTLPLR